MTWHVLDRGSAVFAADRQPTSTPVGSNVARVLIRPFHSSPGSRAHEISGYAIESYNKRTQTFFVFFFDSKSVRRSAQLPQATSASTINLQWDSGSYKAMRSSLAQYASLLLKLEA